jgi:hypothetical protein
MLPDLQILPDFLHLMGNFSTVTIAPTVSIITMILLATVLFKYAPVLITEHTSRLPALLLYHVVSSAPPLLDSL